MPSFGAVSVQIGLIRVGLCAQIDMAATPHCTPSLLFHPLSDYLKNSVVLLCCIAYLRRACTEHPINPEYQEKAGFGARISLEPHHETWQKGR